MVGLTEEHPGSHITRYEREVGTVIPVKDIFRTGSPHSRNNRAGFLIGQGYSVEEAKAKVGMVVEGLNALPAAMRLIERYGVEMPIVETANAVVNGHISPKDAVTALMMREKKNETIPWTLQSEG